MFNFNKKASIIEKNFYKNFKLYLNTSGNISYKPFPKPHLLVENSKINLSKTYENDGLFNIKNLKLLLMKISNYVGMYYPGENSLIRNISIQHSEYNIIKRNIISWKDDKRIPLIKNILTYNSYNIYFESIERPLFNKKNIKIKKSMKDNVLNLKGNYLIIGGSSGIGNEILNLLKINKNIKIISTYYRNKLENINNSNVKQIKLNVEKDIKKIENIIRSNDFSI